MLRLRLLIALAAVALPIKALADFDLSTCLQHARSANAELAVVKQAVASAEAAIAVARSERGLTVDLASYARVVSVIPEMSQPDKTISTPAGYLVIPGLTLPLGDHDTYSVDLTIRKILYAGGRLDGAVQQSVLQKAVMEEDVLVAQRRLDFQVAFSYINLIRLLQLRHVAEDSLALAQTHAENVRNFEQAGAATSNERLKAQLRVTEAEASLIEIKHRIELQVENLRSLTGWDFELPADVPPVDFAHATESADAGLARAKNHRPEFSRLDGQIRALEHQCDLIRREQRPVISAFGTAAYGKPGPDFVKNQWTDSYQAGVNFNLNIWDNGRIDAREQRLRMDIARLQRQREAQVASVRLEIVQAGLAIRDALARIDVSIRATAQAEENFRITADRFHEGTLTNTDFLDAEIALARARAERVVAETDWQLAWMNYDHSIGCDLSLEGQVR